MTTVTVHEAKTHLSRLIARVLAGEEVTIARGKEPVVRIVPIGPTQAKSRIPGRLAHLVPPGSGDILSHGFWDPLTDEEMGLGPDEPGGR
jgi:prevent-host-death family protein